MELLLIFMGGGIIFSVITSEILKRRYKKEVLESYDRGYAAGREIEQRAIFDYIEMLNVDANSRIYENEVLKR